MSLVVIIRRSTVVVECRSGDYFLTLEIDKIVVVFVLGMRGGKDVKVGF